MRKNSVFLSFCATFLKECEKQCFFTFFETLCTKFAKNAKNSVFELFARRSSKCVRNSVFSRFSSHFVQSSQKMRKNSVLKLFARRSWKSVRKQCFFTFFETLYIKFAMRKKQRFLSFLREVPQKVWENSVFSRFSRHFVQSSQKLRINSFFWAFCATFLKKC